MLRWGVIGVGSAGTARVKAIKADPRATLVAGYRGDPRGAGIPAARSIQHLVEAVDAVAVCTPDVTHPDIVRGCLSAGRHVVVEFPLAGTTKVARDLFDLAGRRGKVLHVEHIELLGGAARFLREAAQGRTLVGGAVRFVGARRRGIYGIAHANIARLHRLVDAIGLPEAVQVAERGPRYLVGSMQYPDAEVRLDLRQADDEPRSTSIELRFADGNLRQKDRKVFQDERPVDLPALPPLFVQDQLAATARILDGADAYCSDTRVIEIISLADALVRASPGGGWEPFDAAPRDLPDEDEDDG